MLNAVLHPQLKLKYFQQHGWMKDWIKTAEGIVREEFEKYKRYQSLFHHWYVLVAFYSFMKLTCSLVPDRSQV